MSITDTLFWSSTYSFFAYNTAKMLGYQNESLLIVTFAGLTLGAIRGLYSEDITIMLSGC